MCNGHRERWELGMYKANKIHIQMLKGPVKEMVHGPKPWGPLKRVVWEGSDAHLQGTDSWLVTDVILRNCFYEEIPHSSCSLSVRRS